MAEVFLSAVLPVLFEKLASEEVMDYIKSFLGRGDIVKFLQNFEKNLRYIKAFLNDAEAKQIKEQAVKIWLNDFNCLIYDAEDVLDYFSTEVLRSRAESEAERMNESKLKFTCFCNGFSSVKAKVKSRKLNAKTEAKIKDITQKLDYRTHQMSELGLTQIVGRNPISSREVRETSSAVDESRVLGRIAEGEKLIHQLLEDRSSELTVIPITGMGGIGKTTLAQIVYNNQRVKNHFNLQAWVCVSDEFDVKRLSKQILESVTSTACTIDNLNEIQSGLKKALTGKKALIVLDDVWSHKYTDWTSLQVPLKGGAAGTVIIVTTRIIDIAKMMGTIDYHPLKELSEDECWTVFEQHAFKSTRADRKPNLEEIGKQIAKRCKGLPLAAKTLGGLLCHTEEEADWEDILKSEIWDIPQAESDILPALRLSYYHLPSHLKQCFSYCSILPKDYEFEETELVLLWMAQGFLQQSREKQMEDIGRKIFRDLLSRSLFQPSSVNESLYVMHDLVNDLAQWAAGDTCFKLEDHRQGKIPNGIRHSSFVPREYDCAKRFESILEAETLRSFMPFPVVKYFSNHISYTIPKDLAIKLQCLRSLSLSRYSIREMPDEIGDLKLLRYLNLSYTHIRNLPDSVSTLYNLQTLILRHCRHLEKLPKNLGNLVNLHHLDIRDSKKIQMMPEGIKKLTSLQMLSNFIVGNGSSSKISELGNLKHLCGALSFSKLENVVCAQDPLEAKLRDKHGLKQITMEWSDLNSNSFGKSNHTDILNILQPFQKLEKLVIHGFLGASFPNWMGDSLFGKLLYLELANCSECTFLPPLGQLPSLQHLEIKRMNGVKSVGLEFYGKSFSTSFPSLKTLLFEDMKEWEDWCLGTSEEERVEFKCLSNLAIKRCSKLLTTLAIKACPKLENLVICGCGQLEVSIPSCQTLCGLEIDGCKDVIYSSGEINDGSLLRNGFDLLCHLTSLSHLEIRNTPQLTSFSLSEEDEQQQLEFPNRLEYLEIRKCQNLEKMRDLHYLTSLNEIKIENCDSLTFFARGQLPPTLENVTIEDCANIQYLVEEEDCFDISSQRKQEKSNIGSTSLSITIDNCKSFKTFSSTGELTVALNSLAILNCPELTSLSSLPNSLYIAWCPKLESIAEMLHNNMFIERLTIKNCENLKTLPQCLHNLTNLRSIDISFCQSLVSIPQLGNTIIELRIKSCEKLEGLPSGMHNLTSLKELYINSCPSIISFPEEGFPTNLIALTLRDLNICKAVFDWGLHKFTCLQELGIFGGCPDLVSFPQLPTTLTSLYIGNFPNLENLSSKGFENLSSLEYLYIRTCQNLKYLPEKGLPPSLMSLLIIDCPLLKQSCMKDGGQYWEAIAKIPDAQIDDTPIRHLLKEMPYVALISIITFCNN